MTYEAADGSALPLLLFEPDEGARALAGIVMFHGGGLRTGSADTLVPHCRRLASHGILAASAGYRLVGQGADGIDDCVADVRLAIARFRDLAAARGLGPSLLASGGSSAGAHLALVVAMIGSSGDPVEARVVALNPAGLDLGAFSPELRRSIEQKAGIAEGRALDYSLIEFVRPGNPPTLIHHGTDDEVEPIANVRRFRDAMASAGNECRVFEYEGAEHAFHHPGGGHFDAVMDVTRRFLIDGNAESIGARP